MLQNFRPGVIERLGLDYDGGQGHQPRASSMPRSPATATKAPGSQRPGQDLLAQARSGVMWLNGDDDQGPVPFGLAIADMLAGAAVAQGILASLVRRGITGAGAHVETSLLEALVDFQFEVLTTHLNDGRRTAEARRLPLGARLSLCALWRLPDRRWLPCRGHDAARQARRPASPCPRSRPIATTRKAGSPHRDADQADHRRAARDRDRPRTGSPSSSRPTSGAPRC